MSGANKVRPGRVLVTGASRGIGRAVVQALVARRTRVAAVARDGAALEALAAGSDGRIVPVVADLAAGRLHDVVARAVEALGRLDGLVCAAGVARHASVGAIDEADLRAQLEVNLVAPLLLSQAFAVHARLVGHGGSIVHVASTLGIRPAVGTVAYSAAKAGILGITRTLAAELAADGVRVNAVVPGVVDTDMVRTLRLAPGELEPTGADREARIAAQLEALRTLHPLGRLGRPEEIAEAVLYLLDAPWTTGAVLAVDGGLLVG